MDRQTEAENALIYQIRSAAQRAHDPGNSLKEKQEYRRKLNQLGADLTEIRKTQERKKQKCKECTR